MARYERPLPEPWPFEEIDHTADAALRVHGRSAEETLAHLVLGYAELVSGGVVPPSETTLTVHVEADESTMMAIDVLRELLFEFDCHGWVPRACEVELFDEARGCTVHVEVGRLKSEQMGEGLVLKAVTFHGARFEAPGPGHEETWLAEVIFDV